MEIRVKSLKLKLDFSFILVISFAVLYGYLSGLKLIAFSVLHELGHLAALLFFGARISVINLSFFGFGIKYDNSLSALQEGIMLICGPAVNLALFLVFRDEINLSLLLLNLFPAFPLDGGRLIMLLLPNAGRYVSLFFLVTLLFIAVFIFIRFKVFALLIISVYLLLFNMRLL